MSNSPVPHKDLDLVAFGDLVLDFTCLGRSDTGMMLFERNPGGAPMNVAAQLTRLGGKAAVAACVGEDEHGVYLRELMRGLGVDATNVGACPGLGTRILFVYFDEDNDRRFSDYKGPRSDLELSSATLDYTLVERTKVLLYSALCNTYDRPIYEATRRALDIAANNGALIAFDANYRFPYTDEKLRLLDIETIRSAHILKMTSEEFAYYLDEDDVMRGSEALLAGNARVVAVSMGADGCFIRTRNGYARRPAYEVKVADTTGAGDSFMGALLYWLTRPGVDVEALTPEELGRMAEFANACASASTTRRGSLLVMPDMAEATELMNSGAKKASSPAT